jgi:hypothetical protein
MAKRFKNLRNGTPQYDDDWGPKNEDRWKEKQRGKKRTQKRKHKHREKFQNFKDFNET